MPTLHHHPNFGSPNSHGGVPPLSAAKEIAPVYENEGKNTGRKSNASVEMMDLESGVKTGKDCRICHLSIDATNLDSGNCFELGCSCKDDLAAAHKQCAELWFKIKGDQTCEICGSSVRNLTGTETNDTEFVVNWNEAASTVSEPGETVAVVERRRLCHRHRFLNFLVACMVFAFIVSWLFHFKIRP